jgi:hypothetical protein
VPSKSELPGQGQQKTLMPFKIYRCRCRYVPSHGIDVGDPREEAMQPGWSDRGPLRLRARCEIVGSCLNGIVDRCFAIRFYVATLICPWVLPLLQVRRDRLCTIFLCRSSPRGAQVAKRPAMAMMASFVHTMLRKAGIQISDFTQGKTRYGSGLIWCNRAVKES